jgi:ABC-type nitrate/sulfonate/bicarbonate transport system permease component
MSDRLLPLAHTPERATSETAFTKVVLIAIGVAPVMIRDIAAHVMSLPREQIIKAETLGANSWQIIARVALPQAMPRLRRHRPVTPGRMRPMRCSWGTV